MKALAQTILFTLVLTATSIVGAAVYKYIDENGNVAYGDKPVQGSEKVKIHKAPRTASEPDTEQSEGVSEEPASSDSETKNKSVNYKSLQILTPKPGKVVDARSGSVQVIFLPSPPLGKNDVLVITVDGKDVSKGRDPNLSLSNMRPGSHSVVGRILNSEGQTKIQSPSVSFEVGSQ